MNQTETDEDDRYLREHWGQQTPEELATHLERNVGAVKTRVSVLGFARQRRRNVK